MPALKTYDLFISHAWKYGGEYDNLVQLLNSAPYFYYRNYSGPAHKPLIPVGVRASDKRVTDAIDRKIRPVNCVLVLSGMYAAHREWIQTEINTAVAYGKPIIGVAPRGLQRFPSAVTDVAREIVRWNTASIVSAIRAHSI